MNFKESKAIYLQIADRICDEVLLGQYRTIICNRRKLSITNVVSVISSLPVLVR